MYGRLHLGWLWGGVLLTALSPLGATADVFDDLEVHGFATQGFVKSTANRFFGDSGHGSLEFSELGINATLEPTPSVRLSGQLLSRHAGDMYSGSPSVDFALADFTVRSSESDSLGIMIGRIKNPLGLFNETRDVAFTRPGIFLPQVIYFDKARNLIMSSDGLGLRMGWYGETLNGNLYLAAGQPLMDENVEHAYLGAGYAGEFETRGLSYIARLLLESPDDRLRTSFSIASTSLAFQREPIDPIDKGDVDFTYWIASLQYATESWTFTTEFMREPIEWRGFSGSIFEGMNTTAEGYFVQAAWQANADIELMFRYEEGFADRADRSGRQLQQRTFGLVPAHSRYSKILTAGIRWDLSPDMMLRAEYQRHHGTFVLSSRENSAAAAMRRDWDMFSLSASYRF